MKVLTKKEFVKVYLDDLYYFKSRENVFSIAKAQFKCLENAFIDYIVVMSKENVRG